MLLFGGMWKTFEPWTRKATEPCTLTGAFRRIQEGNVESNLYCGTSAQEISEGSYISSCARDFSCDVLAKNVAAFYLWPKNFPEVKFKARKWRDISFVFE